MLTRDMVLSDVEVNRGRAVGFDQWGIRGLHIACLDAAIGDAVGRSSGEDLIGATEHRPSLSSPAFVLTPGPFLSQQTVVTPLKPCSVSMEGVQCCNSICVMHHAAQQSRKAIQIWLRGGSTARRPSTTLLDPDGNLRSCVHHEQRGCCAGRRKA